MPQFDQARLGLSDGAGARGGGLALGACLTWGLFQGQIGLFDLCGSGLAVLYDDGGRLVHVEWSYCCFEAVRRLLM